MQLCSCSYTAEMYTFTPAQHGITCCLWFGGRAEGVMAVVPADVSSDAGRVAGSLPPVREGGSVSAGASL